MFSKAFLLDAAERVLSTYVQAFLGLLVAGQAINISTVEAAATAAIPAALSLLKALIASRVGDATSASLVE